MPSYFISSSLPSLLFALVEVSDGNDRRPMHLVTTPRAVFALYLTAQSDVNLRSHDNGTPLINGIVSGDGLTVKALLAVGANPNVVVDHWSPLLFAVSGTRALSKPC